MLEQLIQMATQQLGSQLQDHPEVQAAGGVDVASVAQTAGSSIFEQIANQVGSGNVGGLTEMLNGSQTAAGSPATTSMAQNVVTSLIEKNGLSPQLAQTISSVAIPAVMNMFNGHVNNAQSSGMDIGSLISGALSGGGNSGGGGLIGGLLGSVMGGGNNQSSMGANILSSVLGQIVK